MNRESVKHQLMKHELSFGLVAERLKRALQLSTDLELAALLGMSSSNFANRKRAESIPFDLVIPLCVSRSVSIDWLCTGLGHAFTDGRVADLTQIASIESLLLGDVVVELSLAFNGRSEKALARKLGTIAALVYNKVAPERDRERRMAKIKETAQLLAEAADRLEAMKVEPDAPKVRRAKAGR